MLSFVFWARLHAGAHHIQSCDLAVVFFLVGLSRSFVLCLVIFSLIHDVSPDDIDGRGLDRGPRHRLACGKAPGVFATSGAP